jgi:biotin operon repressor
MDVLERTYEVEDRNDDWWSLLDNEVLDCLGCGRPLSPEELGDKLGMSAAAAASLVTMLVSDGRVRITSVERVEDH